MCEGLGYMDEVADMLGVKLSEAFELRDGADVLPYQFKLTKCGLSRLSKGHWETIALLDEVLTGRLTIIAKPFTPVNGATYYAIDMTKNYVCCEKYTWQEDATDILLYKAGLIHKRYKECVTSLKDDYKKLTGQNIDDKYMLVNDEWVKK